LIKIDEEGLRGKVNEVQDQIGERKLKSETTLVISGNARSGISWEIR
jgi:16S rRNA C1402 (ribose-2'-O) methylase RsmI